MTLNDFGLKHGTDKASNLHDFLRFYEKRLSYLRSSEFVLIEFGIYLGASIRMWSEYFPNAKIIGVDIEPKPVDSYGPNVSIRIGDATHGPFLKSLLDEFGPPTLVLDDASHRWDHQIATFQWMLPFIRPGGIFILEDIDTSFGGHGDGFVGYANTTAFNYVTNIALVVAAGGALGKERPQDLFTAMYGPTISSIEFFQRTCLVTKR